MKVEAKEYGAFELSVLEREVARMGKSVKMYFENFGKIKPHVVVFSKSKGGLEVGGGVIPEEMMENRQEALFMAGHQMRHEQKEVLAVMFSVEAWYRTYDEKEQAAMKKLGIDPEQMRPSKSPNRKEAVMVYAMNKGRDVATCMYEVKKDANGKRVCVEIPQNESPMPSTAEQRKKGDFVAKDNLLVHFWNGYESDCGNESH